MARALVLTWSIASSMRLWILSSAAVHETVRKRRDSRRITDLRLSGADRDVGRGERAATEHPCLLAQSEADRVRPDRQRFAIPDVAQNAAAAEPDR